MYLNKNINNSNAMFNMCLKEHINVFFSAYLSPVLGNYSPHLYFYYHSSSFSSSNKPQTLVVKRRREHKVTKFKTTLWQ